MDETLKSSEEKTGDTVEDKAENSEDSEVGHVVLIVLRLEGVGICPCWVNAKTHSLAEWT